MDIFQSLSFPLWFVLIPFVLFFALFLIYNIFNMYHLLRFGVFGFGLYLITTIYTLGTFLLVCVAFFILVQYDWTTSVDLGQLLAGYSDSIFPTL
ncbi:TPA: hypothetical protein DEP26_05090 [Candidatus Uhrbacteria bacterium]|nr:hypothetical protein [Candidatus Uhrbacteria bacterium]